MKLTAKWTLETRDEFFAAYSWLHKQGVEYSYITPVKWYQFWRWHLTFRDNYILSRADTIAAVILMVKDLKKEIDEEIKQVLENPARAMTLNEDHSYKVQDR